VISDSLRAVYGLGPPAHTTRISDEFWRQLPEESVAFNCRFLSERPAESPAMMYGIVVETFYEQPQLLRLPPISNKL
jgi:hypothetical protein